MRVKGTRRVVSLGLGTAANGAQVHFNTRGKSSYWHLPSCKPNGRWYAYEDLGYPMLGYDGLKHRQYWRKHAKKLLIRGSSGEGVRRLQKNLNAALANRQLIVDGKNILPLATDGKFGRLTEAAVRQLVAESHPTWRFGAMLGRIALLPVTAGDSGSPVGSGIRL